MHVTALVFIVWGVAWLLLESIAYSGAVPINYSREQLLNIRELLPPAPIHPLDVQQTIRSNKLNVIRATRRGTSAGRHRSRPITQRITYRSLSGITMILTTPTCIIWPPSIPNKGAWYGIFYYASSLRNIRLVDASIRLVGVSIRLVVWRIMGKDSPDYLQLSVFL